MHSLNTSKIVTAVFDDIQRLENNGQLASYIPELANVDLDKFGVYISRLDGKEFGIGDFAEKFSIQSISKVFVLTLAYGILGGKMWDRVGVEPSGNPFNSLVQLERDNGIPRNPFLNGGAMVVCDIILSQFKNAKEELLSYIRKVTENDGVVYSPRIVASEKSIGYRNIALCNFIKSFDNIENAPDDVLDLYFNMCSIEMSCKELAKGFLYLANNGTTVSSKEKILTLSQSKRVNAILQTCGFYDESGEFAYKVGLPGKSGVGGGIIAINPNKYTVAVWSPLLNPKGNSYKGMKFLESFTTETSSSIF